MAEYQVKIKPYFSGSLEHFGGTEYMLALVNNSLQDKLPKLNNYLCLAAPGQVVNSLDIIDKRVILYAHNLPFQFGPEFYHAADKVIMRNLHYLIVPSEYSKQRWLAEFPDYLSPEQVFVIPNAIIPNQVDLENKSRRPVKFIYVSDPGRGLQILLDAFSLWQREDVILEIFTDQNPHIQGYSKELSPNYFQLETLKNDPRIFQYGRTNKYTLARHFANAHAFVYPAIYAETSCISLMEALNAGLYCVTSNTGALKETGKRHLKTFEWTPLLKRLVDEDKAQGVMLNSYINLHPEDYQKNLQKVVDVLEKTYMIYKDGIFDPYPQMAFSYNRYAWENVRERWLEFHDMIPE